MKSLPDFERFGSFVGFREAAQQVHLLEEKAGVTVLSALEEDRLQRLRRHLNNHGQLELLSDTMSLMA